MLTRVAASTGLVLIMLVAVFWVYRYWPSWDLIEVWCQVGFVLIVIFLIPTRVFRWLVFVAIFAPIVAMIFLF